MSKRRHCKVADFERVLSEVLEQYGEEAGRNTAAEVLKIGEKTRQAVETNITTAGIGGTEYKDSIKMKFNKAAGGFRLFSAATIYSPEHYRLTHLLENGHRIVIRGKDTGDDTKARPHWKQAEEAAIRELEAGIRKAVTK